MNDLAAAVHILSLGKVNIDIHSHQNSVIIMASRNFTPVNQIKLTNVAIVRHKKGGKRFELACYRNKVLGWRNKVETDIDEVVQTHTIFNNASKGQFAKKADLTKAYGTDDEEKIVLEILAKGQLQVSKEEREQKQEATYTEVAKLVSERCINPDTKKPYTIAQIERAMKDVHVSIRTEQSSKKQALEVIKTLKENDIPIERANLLLRIWLPQSQAKTIKSAIKDMLTIESEEWDDDLELLCSIDPGKYRAVSDAVQAQSKGKGIVEIMEVKSVGGGDDEAI